jgi:hypothetical protein
VQHSTGHPPLPSGACQRSKRVPAPESYATTRACSQVKGSGSAFLSLFFAFPFFFLFFFYFFSLFFFSFFLLFFLFFLFFFLLFF